MIIVTGVLRTLGVEAGDACSCAASLSLCPSRDKPKFDSLNSELEHKSNMVTSLVGGEATFVEHYGRGRLPEAAHGIRRNLSKEQWCEQGTGQREQKGAATDTCIPTCFLKIWSFFQLFDYSGALEKIGDSLPSSGHMGENIISFLIAAKMGALCCI